MYYLSYQSGTGLLVGISNQTPPAIDGIVTEAREGDVPDLNVHVWRPETLTLERTQDATMTRLAFLRLFTPQERITVRTLTTTDPVVNDFMSMVDLAEEIRLSDPDLQLALGYLVQLGVLTSTRVNEILG